MLTKSSNVMPFRSWLFHVGYFSVLSVSLPAGLEPQWYCVFGESFPHFHVFCTITSRSVNLLDVV